MKAQPLRALIVDDEPPARQAMARLLHEVDDVLVVEAAADGLQALHALAHTRVDLLFLDIEMPALGGLELATRLHPAITPAVVFVSAWPQYAVAAFDVGAADYLLKPVDPARLKAAIVRARRRLVQPELEKSLRRLRARQPAAASPGHVWVDHGSSRLRLAVGDIEWFAGDGDYVQAHTAERGYLMRGTLSQLEATLPPDQFLRVHRSTLINTDAVAQVASAHGHLLLTTRSGATLKVGRRARSRVRHQLEGLPNAVATQPSDQTEV